MNTEKLMQERIQAALGEKPAELVLKNADIFNVFTGETEHGDLAVTGGFIVGIGSYDGETEVDATGKTIVPGLIDGHVHLESSIVTPQQYAKVVLPHGTTAVVADPHEIANVCGTAGIDYMLKATEQLPLDVYLMFPSCVPASPFDESGCRMGAEELGKYIGHPRVLGLAEMMNFPGVFAGDSEVMRKIAIAAEHGKITDGHAPGITGKQLNAYTAAGVYSDHECTDAEEALEKLRRGQWIMVREGTACKNLEALLPVCREPYAQRCIFATDDKHPGDLAKEGHIDHIIRKAIQNGVKPETAYRMGTLNAAAYFHLPLRGAVAPGYRADFLVLNDFSSVDIAAVYKDGKKAAELQNGQLRCVGETDATSDAVDDAAICQTVHIGELTAADFVIHKPAKVIGLVKNEILTTDEGITDKNTPERDILKLAVVERHHNTGHMGLCYLKGYGLKKGAVATSIAHDSHNIICVGTNDADMAAAVMEIKRLNGGMVVVCDGETTASLSLPIAGLMCDLSAEEAQRQLDAVKQAAHEAGVLPGIDPFMTLSFASLAVIPTLRLTTLGVVDVNRFCLLNE